MTMILFFDRKRCTTVYDSNGRDQVFVGEDGTFLLKNVLTTVNVRSVISDMIPNTIKYRKPIKNLPT